MKKRMTIDTLLLLLILIMQIGIFLSFHMKRNTSTNQPSEPLSAAVHERPQAMHPNTRPDSFRMASFEEMNNHMNRMLEQAMNEFEYMQALIDVDDIWHAMPATPAMDMRETEDSYTIAFSLPGINPEEIIVTLNDRELAILSPAHGVDLNTRILLPGPVKNSEYAKSVFTNGVLTVNVPKDREIKDNSETLGL